MIISKAIPICRGTFQGEALMSSSPKNLGALSSSPSSSPSPRRKPAQGVVTMSFYIDSVKDPHTTLGIEPGASKYEIKKAYRRLALQFHPDVCDSNHCITNFQRINFAYETLLSMTSPHFGEFEDDLSDNLEGFAGINGDSWEDWEEWMGWEGAGTRDYSNHINHGT